MPLAGVGELLRHEEPKLEAEGWQWEEILGEGTASRREVTLIWSL